MSRVQRGWKRTLGPLEEQQVFSRGELSPHLWTPLLLKQMQRIRESTATFGKDYTGIPPQKSLSVFTGSAATYARFHENLRMEIPQSSWSLKTGQEPASGIRFTHSPAQGNTQIKPLLLNSDASRAMVLWSHAIYSECLFGQLQ